MLGHFAEQEYDAASGADTADAAITAYKKALELSPGSPVILERLAEIYAKSQHTRDAVATAQEVLKVDPKNIAAHRLLAFIYYRALGDPSAGDLQQENLNKAVENFQAILDADPRDLNASLMLARLYGFENKHDEAEKILRNVLTRNADNGQALEQLSQLLLDENRSQEAIDLLKQAVMDSDDDPEIYDLLGDAYSQAKDYPNAEAAYRKAMEEDPDDPGHLHGLADALLAQDKYADALKQYQKLAQLEPASANNYLRMAELYRRLGQFTESRSSLERAKQLAPGNLEIIFSEALLDEDQGHPDEAIKLLNGAISDVKSQSAGENAGALTVLYEQLGRAYQSQQNYPAAVGAYRSMESLSPEARKRGQMLVIDAYREGRADRPGHRRGEDRARPVTERPRPDHHAGLAVRRKVRHSRGHEAVAEACCAVRAKIRKSISISRKCRSAANNMPMPSSPRRRPSRWRRAHRQRIQRASCWASSTSGRRNSIWPKSSFAKCWMQIPTTPRC